MPGLSTEQPRGGKILKRSSVLLYSNLSLHTAGASVFIIILWGGSHISLFTGMVCMSLVLKGRLFSKPKFQAFIPHFNPPPTPKYRPFSSSMSHSTVWNYVHSIYRRLKGATTQPQQPSVFFFLFFFYQVIISPSALQNFTEHHSSSLSLQSGWIRQSEISLLLYNSTSPSLFTVTGDTKRSNGDLINNGFLGNAWMNVTILANVPDTQKKKSWVLASSCLR